MSEILIKKQHRLEPDEVRERLKIIEADLVNKFSLKTEWSGDMISIKGTGVKNGYLKMNPGEVELFIKLSLLARPLKGRIESGIQKKMNENFSG